MDITKLVGQLPNRFGTPQKIADRLNEKATLTPYGRQYTVQNVRNSLNGEHADDNVILELIEIVKEYKNDRAFLSSKINSVLSA